MQRSKPGHEPANRQLGVTERPQEHLVLAALSFTAADPAACQQALEQLRSLVRAELEDELADETIETGELGYGTAHNDYNLTITVGFSTTGYDKLSIAPERRPRDLAPMPPDVLDASGQQRGARVPGEGDVILKVCSDDIYVAEHVLRRVEHELGGNLGLTWAQTGVQRYNTRQSKNPRHESRALIGFLDGTANLDPANAEDRALIFTNHQRFDYPSVPGSDQYNGATFPGDLRAPPAEPEPAVLDGGTYLNVEVLLQQTTAFDNQPLAEQERVVGRQKKTGEPLPQAVPVSHVLKANPGRPEDAPRRVLRRGYSLLRPEGGGLARGLVFIAFGRSLSTQAEFIRRAWINNDNFPAPGTGKDLLLSQYVDPQLVCGGNYFVPPLEHAARPWSWLL